MTAAVKYKLQLLLTQQQFELIRITNSSKDVHCTCNKSFTTAV